MAVPHMVRDQSTEKSDFRATRVARAVSLDQLDDPVPTGWAAHIHFKLCEPSPASYLYLCVSKMGRDQADYLIAFTN
jgi:hypothetical protein